MKKISCIESISMDFVGQWHGKFLATYNNGQLLTDLVINIEPSSVVDECAIHFYVDTPLFYFKSSFLEKIESKTLVFSVCDLKNKENSDLKNLDKIGNVKIDLEYKFNFVISLGNFYLSANFTPSKTFSPFSPDNNNGTIIPSDNEKGYTWKQFKEELKKYCNDEWLFRGQSGDWKLMTSFHRTTRVDVPFYMENDVKELHARLSSLTPHYFRINENVDEKISFINLLQHHGYPTPFLDWTTSPYISAFFALEACGGNPFSDGFVNIFLFNKKNWDSISHDNDDIFGNSGLLSINLLSPISIANNRMVHQKGIVMGTNILNLESFLLDLQEKYGKQLITRLKIREQYKSEALSDLRYMGISNGYLFPDLDGICKDYKFKNF